MSRRSRPLCRALAAAFLFVIAAASPAFAAEADPAVRDRVLLDSRITESSGLARSIQHPGVLWTHNDSGSRARLYAVGEDGRTKADYLLAGVQARDWEAMASSRDSEGRAWLWVGDIGDNSSTRTQGILVHRVAEPDRLTGGTLKPTSYRLRYPDDPRDAEALLVHPRTGRLYIVTKGVFGGVVYRAPERLRTDAPNILERVGTAPAIVTDGVFLADGRAALLSYSDITVTSDLDDSGSERVTVPFDMPRVSGSPPQAESIAVGPPRGGLATVLVGTEGARSPVLRITLPDSPKPRSTSAGLAEQAVGKAVDSVRSMSPAVVVGLGIAAAVLLALVLGRRRRF